MVGKSIIDISTVPRYACYEELYDCMKQCHIDQEGHSGIRKTEKNRCKTLSFGRCSLNERCKGPKRTLTE